MSLNASEARVVTPWLSVRTPVIKLEPVDAVSNPVLSLKVRMSPKLVIAEFRPDTLSLSPKPLLSILPVPPKPDVKDPGE
jgi:hypothetical protein